MKYKHIFKTTKIGKGGNLVKFESRNNHTNGNYV